MKRLTLPFPPSINGYWRTFRSRQIISRRGREYRAKVVDMLAGKVETFTGPLEVRIDLFPKDRRRRDVDNYSKAILDALTHAGAWEDDSQIVKMTVEKHLPDGEGTVVVDIIEWSGHAQF